MNRGSTCASVQGEIEQYMNELRSKPQEEDALSFWQKRQASYPLLAPLAEDLLSAISGLCRAGLLCLWLADSRTEKPLDKEPGAASVLENKQRTVITMTVY